MSISAVDSSPSINLSSFTEQVIATRKALQNKSYKEGSIERIFSLGSMALVNGTPHTAVEKELSSLANRCLSTGHEDLWERVTHFIQNHRYLKSAKMNDFLYTVAAWQGKAVAGELHSLIEKEPNQKVFKYVDYTSVTNRVDFKA